MSASGSQAWAIERPVVVTGGLGQLGRAMGLLLGGTGPGVTITTREQVDLAFPQTIRALAGRGFRTYINCAAWTDVDGAEKDEAGATAVNGEAVGILAEQCRREGALLVTYSTDYVFDGTATTPYRTDHPRSPIGAYGRSKAVGEELLERSGCEYLLIRTSWVYAPEGKNFVRTILGAARKNPRLRVVDDQRGRPTSAENLARVTLRLLEKGARGTFHVTDGGECTWYGFAREIVRLGGLSTPVEPCTSAEYPRPARRPAYSVLDITETEALVGAMTPWQEALAGVVTQMTDGAPTIVRPD